LKSISVGQLRFENDEIGFQPPTCLFELARAGKRFYMMIPSPQTFCHTFSRGGISIQHKYRCQGIRLPYPSPTAACPNLPHSTHLRLIFRRLNKNKPVANSSSTGKLTQSGRIPSRLMAPFRMSTP